jgi:excisionase family DNA binding protein
MKRTPAVFTPPSGRIAIPEIAKRLNVGRVAVYTMLELQIIPGIRLGRRWIVTRHAFEQWERTCGVNGQALLHERPELMVVT